MRRDQCSFTSIWHVLLWGSYVRELISCLIKHSRSDRSLHAAIHFVVIAVRIRIQSNGSTPILILCFRFFGVEFAFVIHIYIAQVESWLYLSRPRLPTPSPPLTHRPTLTDGGRVPGGRHSVLTSLTCHLTRSVTMPGLISVALI